MRRIAGVASAIALFAIAAPAPAQDDLEALLEQGRFQEAYDAAAADDQRLRAAARLLLGTSMASDDSYRRWFALRASQAIVDPTLVPYARQALAKGDRYDKSLALDILAKTDPAGNREELVAALDSDHRSLRVRAINALASLRDPSLAPQFAHVVAKDEDPDLRVFAIRGLAQTGSPQAPAALYGALEDDVAAVREEAVQALVSLRSPGLTAVLRRRLAEAPPEGRVHAVRLASFSANPALLPDLGPFLADGDPEVRAYAAAAILAIAERAEKP